MRPGSFFRLGWYFFKRLSLRMLRPEHGLARFQANYWQGEHLLPVSEEERQALGALSRCIACGMCDLYFTAWDGVSESRFSGPSALPLSYTRSLPDYDAMDGYLQQLRRGDLQRLEQVCPVDVPFRALADFAESRGRQARRADDPAPGKRT
jgi:succinate dehydrogenase/fumarate reductase-like Fe-S protein